MRLSDSGEALASIAVRRHTEPARLTRLVRGELDWIVMRALEKDRTRRYETAAAFARDVERHLSDEAVEACPPSWRYRLSKFAGKNRVALGTAAAFAALLLAATVVSGYLALRATTTEALANRRRVDVEVANEATSRALAATAKALRDSERAREQAEALSKFLVDAFRRPDPSHDGRTLKVVDLLDSAVARLDSETALSPAIRGEILRALGETYLGLGLHDQAAEVLKKARALLRSSLGPNSRAALVASVVLAEAYGSPAYIPAARPSELVALLKETRDRIAASLGPDDPLAIHCRTNLAMAYGKAGRNGEAIALHEEMLRLGEARLGPDVPEIGSLLRNNAAIAYNDAGRHADAIGPFREAIHLAEAESPRNESNLFALHHRLAQSYRSAGRLADAIASDEQALELGARTFGADHTDVIDLRTALADKYREAGRRAPGRGRDHLRRLAQPGYGHAHRCRYQRQRQHRLRNSGSRRGRDLQRSVGHPERPGRHDRRQYHGAGWRGAEQSGHGRSFGSHHQRQLGGEDLRQRRVRRRRWRVQRRRHDHAHRLHNQREHSPFVRPRRGQRCRHRVALWLYSRRRHREYRNADGRLLAHQRQFGHFLRRCLRRRRG